MKRLPWMILLVLFSCGKELPTLESIDLNTWKEDKNGCGQVRTASVASLEEQKEKLLGLSEKQIIELLGRPDRNELYKRNQKFYYFSLDPASGCPSPHASPRELILRFNAMGFVKEVALEAEE